MWSHVYSFLVLDLKLSVLGVDVGDPSATASRSVTLESKVTLVDISRSGTVSPVF